MWIYFISLTISIILTSAILSILIPRLKKREERENTFAAENKMVFPDKKLKTMFIVLSFFCLFVGVMILFVPQICEVLKFDWLITNIVWNSVLLIDLSIVLYGYQTLYVSYNDEFILITNLFHKTNKITYEQIVGVSSNIIIFTKNRQYCIPCSLFYGTQALKNKILDRVN